ncbi:hypothetical protein SAOR_00930 [Salinisphaera orenii MK-B5]|uniref:Uncharacterized protein n=1 Tax=Salinisphaera orenii MK-B5 TaxID=856730 RepID=A0A423PYB6_9GAMM|nr:hypothetical protein [Salinisphaera orenii]ROO30592.1 hypothetical protein SAOR_00930 [Salinisphaera orenii MK-B5]
MYEQRASWIARELLRTEKPESAAAILGLAIVKIADESFESDDVRERAIRGVYDRMVEYYERNK